MFFNSFLFNGGQRYRSDSDSDSDRPPSELMPKPSRGREDSEETSQKQQKLMDALDGKFDVTEAPLVDTSELLGEDLTEEAKARMKTLCSECLDQPAMLMCQGCDEQFCEVCFGLLHRKGKRKEHKTIKLDNQEIKQNNSKQAEQAIESIPHETDVQSPVAMSAASSVGPSSPPPQPHSLSDSDDEDLRSTQSDLQRENPTSPSASSRVPNNFTVTALCPLVPFSPDWFVERAKYIPQRLTLAERKSLRLVEAALTVSEYTDKVDILHNSDRAKRIHEQIKDCLAILSGLVVACDYKLGQQLIEEKEFADNAEFFQTVFEIARRHKIRNPEKMRANWGKLMCLLQDSQQPEIQELLGFSLVKPIKTVYRVLEQGGSLEMLRDPRMVVATGEIKADNKPRPVIDAEIRRKNDAIKALAQQYSNQQLDKDEIESVIYSIGDNHTYLIQNRNSCDAMLAFLSEQFHPTEPEGPYSLAIVGGRGGARLTHSHEDQFTYVQQSLYLWREILHEMFYFWVQCEQDLLDSANPYRLRNTGQGLNRVQQCPRVGRGMQNILYGVQRRLGSWIGSSVVHLGDAAVPNAMVFLMKYNDVSRILNPILQVLRAIPRLAQKPDIRLYFDRCFGGADKLIKLILTDFFRHGFDGSGADDFFFSGSCIDGRLSSAWEFCNKIEKKPYFHVFLLAGFTGFDGQFSD